MIDDDLLYKLVRVKTKKLGREELVKIIYEELIKIKKERNRIDELIDEINSEIMKYLKEKKALIDETIKPFKVNVKKYNNPDEIQPMSTHVVTIALNPQFKISFIQKDMEE